MGHREPLEKTRNIEKDIRGEGQRMEFLIMRISFRKQWLKPIYLWIPVKFHLLLFPHLRGGMSPVIMRQCENMITGDPYVHIYEFLKREYSIAGLQQGLSICNQLKGIEYNFTRYGTCKSFDVIDKSEEIANILSGIWDLKRDYYDLFLCVDLLSYVKNLDEFLKDMGATLKEQGVIIAMEYIGPA